MTTLKEAALAYTKKDIFSLAKIPVDVEIKKDNFEKNGKLVDYFYIDIENWKYTISSSAKCQVHES
jgi:hypothetical protein